MAHLQKYFFFWLPYKHIEKLLIYYLSVQDLLKLSAQYRTTHKDSRLFEASSSTQRLHKKHVFFGCLRPLRDSYGGVGLHLPFYGGMDEEKDCIVDWSNGSESDKMIG